MRLAPPSAAWGEPKMAEKWNGGGENVERLRAGMAPNRGRPPGVWRIVLVVVLDSGGRRRPVRVTMLAKKMVGCLVQELVVEVW